MNEVKQRRWASAKKNENFFSIKTFSGYRRCGADPQGAEHILLPSATDEELGTAVLDALAKSRFLSLEEAADFFDLERIELEYASWVAMLSERFGYKTKRALFSTMLSCSIESSDDVIWIRPSRHEKLEAWSGDGITKEDHVSVPGDSAPAVVGTALRLALSRCI